MLRRFGFVGGTGLTTSISSESSHALIERFNGRFRDECLHLCGDTRRKVAAWRADYNSARPHSRSRYRTPMEVAAEQIPVGHGQSNGGRSLPPHARGNGIQQPPLPPGLNLGPGAAIFARRLGQRGLPLQKTEHHGHTTPGRLALDTVKGFVRRLHLP